MRWLACLLLAPLAAVLLFNTYVFGSILTYRAVAPHSTSFMQMRMNQLAGERPDVALDYRWVPYAAIATHLKKALIASEDAQFAAHDGFDWSGIRRAMQQNRRAGQVRAGGSTISQQLAKNLFLNDSRSYVRKVEEAAITAMLEATTDKDRIFELYLNVIEWDYGVFGAEAASQRFFKRSAAQLTPQQAAQLAARVPRPLHYADHPKDRSLRQKTNIILRRMGSATLPESD